MTLPPPWVFAVVGAGFVTISAALSGFYTSHLERAEALVRRKIRELEQDIAFSREYFELGSQKLSLVELKLVLLQSTQPPAELYSKQLNVLARDALRGILDRNSAATGDHPSDDLMQAWMSVTGRAGGGDARAFTELSEISSDLLDKWVDRTNELVKERDKHEARAENTRRKASQAKFAAVALQILGLAIVLMKDLPR